MTHSAAQPLIIYVPGLKPKPEPGLHREQLWRCLLEGVRRVNAPAAAAMEARPRCFDIVGWTYDFYRVHRDLNLDLPAIEALLQQHGASEQDLAEAGAWQRRLLRLAYLLGDSLPFLIPKLADANMEMTLRDVHRYVRNENGIADATRRLLAIPLIAAWRSGRPVLLIAHSMGSVIAYDTLWKLSHTQDEKPQIDTLMTMGSPLGQKYVRRRLQGAKLSGDHRYPTNIGRWLNFAAVGELTALDKNLRSSFAPMLHNDLVESLDDYVVHNYFRLHGKLNVHAEYGYLVNSATAKFVADWWLQTTALTSA